MGNKSEKPEKHSNRHMNDPLRKILKINSEVYKFSQMMNAKVVKILERYELDKPIMMQDKLDMIWDKPPGKVPQSLIKDRNKKDKKKDGLTFDESSDETSGGETARHDDNMWQHVVDKKLKTRKVERKVINQDQIRAYNKLLDFITEQRTKNLYLQDKAEPSYAHPEESMREFLDAFRIIIQSGYFIEQKDFLELIEILKI